MDFLQELYDDCHNLKQTVIKLATESEDNDSSLGEKNGGLVHVETPTSPRTTTPCENILLTEIHNLWEAVGKLCVKLKLNILKCI